MVNVQDCSLEVSEFKPKSYYYVHFRTNKFGKSIMLAIMDYDIKMYGKSNQITKQP